MDNGSHNIHFQALVDAVGITQSGQTRQRHGYKTPGPSTTSWPWTPTVLWRLWWQSATWFTVDFWYKHRNTLRPTNNSNKTVAQHLEADSRGSIQGNHQPRRRPTSPQELPLYHSIGNRVANTKEGYTSMTPPASNHFLQPPHNPVILNSPIYKIV